jgi:hypothetical protein
VLAPLRPLGLRRSLGYSSASMHNRGKTLAFPWLRQYCPRIILPNKFLQGDEIPVDTISKLKKNLWMLLLFL